MFEWLNKETLQKLMFLDIIIETLFRPLFMPISKFYIDQQINPILFGYQIGITGLGGFIFYQIIDIIQKHQRKNKKDPEYILTLPFYFPLIATILSYSLLIMYTFYGANAYFIMNTILGATIYPIITMYFMSMKRILFTSEQRELYDRKCQKISCLCAALSLLLIMKISLKSTTTDPLLGLLLFFLISDFGFIIVLFAFRKYEKKNQNKIMEIEYYI